MSMKLPHISKSNNTMNKEIRKTIVVFFFGFVTIILSERYIGYGKTYGKALHWDEIYENRLSYFVFSAIMALLYLYLVSKKNNNS